MAYFNTSLCLNVASSPVIKSAFLGHGVIFKSRVSHTMDSSQISFIYFKSFLFRHFLLLNELPNLTSELVTCIQVRLWRFPVPLPFKLSLKCITQKKRTIECLHLCFIYLDFYSFIQRAFGYVTYINTILNIQRWQYIKEHKNAAPSVKLLMPQKLKEMCICKGKKVVYAEC